MSVGHLVMLHGCTIGENSLIGIGAIVLNRAVVGKNCLVGAGATVTEGKVIPDNSLVLGVNKIVRTLTPEEVADEHLDRAALRRARRDLPQGPQARRMTRGRFSGSAAAWILLLAYASLYPFVPLRLPVGECDRRDLRRAPRYVTTFDVVVNVLAYVPLGMLVCRHFLQGGAHDRARRS